MTKKILAAALLLVLLSSPVFAQKEPQDYKWTVRTSAAYLACALRIGAGPKANYRVIIFL